jgi:CRISPR-associated protein Cas1
MIKKVVEISHAGTHLSVNLGQLVVKQEGQEKGRIACEDIGVLLVDHCGVCYTHSVLTTLLAHGAAVVLCDGSHHPAGMLFPLESHSVQTERFREQAAASEPLKKRLWQQLIQGKIAHQAAIVADDEATYRALKAMEKRVRSGDPENIEAQASKRYWASFLPSCYDCGRDARVPSKRRRDGAAPNNLLNYGYMVMRAATARALCSAGLLPTLGIHHRNKYNAYCLADDVIEPFRGFVEKKVRAICQSHSELEELTQEIKAQLLDILYDEVEIGGFKGPLMVGLHRTAASLQRCFAGEQNRIDLPVV